MRLIFSLILFILVLFISLAASAQEEIINLAKEDYFSGETVQAEILFRYPLAKEFKVSHLSLYKEDKKTPAGFNLVKLDPKNYYLYFDLPLGLENGTYLLKIEEFYSIQNNILVKNSSLKDFKIKFLNESIPLISIKPGIAVLSDINEFQIEVKNKGKPTKLKISSPSSIIEPLEKEILIENKTTLSFFIKEIYKTYIREDIILEYDNSLYKIPVIITKEIKEKDPIRFIKDKLELTFSSKEGKIGDITFKNFGNLPINNIELTLTGNLNDVIRLDKYFFSRILPNESINLTLIINEYGVAEPSAYSGTLNLETEEGFKTFFNININLLEEKEEIIIENETEEEFIEQEFKTINLTEIKIDKKEKRANYLPQILILIILLIIFSLILKLRGKKEVRKSLRDYISSLKK